MRVQHHESFGICRRTGSGTVHRATRARPFDITCLPGIIDHAMVDTAGMVREAAEERLNIDEPRRLETGTILQ